MDIGSGVSEMKYEEMCRTEMKYEEMCRRQSLFDAPTPYWRNSDIDQPL
jgi:hypothetical protein